MPFQSFTDLYDSVLETSAEKTAIQILHIDHSINSINYASLDRIANRVANLLTRHMPSEQSLIGVCIEKSELAYATLLAIWKTNNVYVPLSINLSKAEINTRSKDSGVKIILCTTRSKHLIEESDDGPVILNLSSLTKHGPISDNYEKKSLREKDRAYLIYTSGTSTGEPKGIMLNHEGIADTINTHIERAGITPSDKILQFADFRVDVSLMEIWMALSTGASICTVDMDINHAVANITDILYRLAVTVAILPPTFLESIIQKEAEKFFPIAETKLSKLTRIISATEAVSKEVLKAWQFLGAGKKRTIYNGYGPTETTIGGTLALYEEGEVAIGTGENSFFGKEIYLLEEASVSSHTPLRLHSLDATNREGEIIITGRGLAEGYWENGKIADEKTKSVFLAGSFLVNGETRNLRVYKTGDLAYTRNGLLYFKSRIAGDRQIKIAGTRIELGAVESTLKMHHRITDAYAKKSEQQLIAYVTIDTEGEAITYASIRSLFTSAKDHNPRELPSLIYVVTKPEMALIKEGKPLGELEDRRVITDLSHDLPIGLDRYRQDLVAIWEETLHITITNLNIDFTSHGGTSLHLSHMLASVKKKFGFNFYNALPPFDLTINNLATTIILAEAYSKSLYRSGSGKTAQTDKILYFIHPVAGSAENNYQRVLSSVGYHGEYRLFRPPLQEPELPAELRSIYQKSEYTLEQLCYAISVVIRMDGPVNRPGIIGWSFGGLAAFEVSRQLRTAGILSTPILIDSPAPQKLADMSLDDFRGNLKFLITKVAEECHAEKEVAAHLMEFKDESIDKETIVREIFSHLIKWIDSESTLGTLKSRLLLNMYGSAYKNYIASLKYRPHHTSSRLLLYTATNAADSPMLETRADDWKPYAKTLEVCTIPDTNHFNIMDSESFLAIFSRHICDIKESPRSEHHPNFTIEAEEFILTNRSGQSTALIDAVTELIKPDSSLKILIIEGGSLSGKEILYEKITYWITKNHANLQFAHICLNLLTYTTEQAIEAVRFKLFHELEKRQGDGSPTKLDVQIVITLYGFDTLKDTHETVQDFYVRCELGRFNAKLLLIGSLHLPEINYAEFMAEVRSDEYKVFSISMLEPRLTSRFYTHEEAPSSLAPIVDIMLNSMPLTDGIYPGIIQLLLTNPSILDYLRVSTEHPKQLLVRLLKIIVDQWIHEQIQATNSSSGYSIEFPNAFRTYLGCLKKIALITYLMEICGVTSLNEEMPSPPESGSGGVASRDADPPAGSWLSIEELRSQSARNYALRVLPITVANGNPRIINRSLRNYLCASMIKESIHSEFNTLLPYTKDLSDSAAEILSDQELIEFINSMLDHADIEQLTLLASRKNKETFSSKMSRLILNAHQRNSQFMLTGRESYLAQGHKHIKLPLTNLQLIQPINNTDILLYSNKRVTIYESTSQRKKITFKFQHRNLIKVIKISDSNSIILVSVDGYITLYNNYEPISEIKVDACICTAFYDANHRKLLTGTSDGIVHVIATNPHEISLEGEFDKMHRDAISSIQYLNAQQLLVSSYDGSLTTLNLKRKSHKLLREPDSFMLLASYYLPIQKAFLLISTTGELKLFIFETGKYLSLLNSGLDISSNCQTDGFIALGSHSGYALILDKKSLYLKKVFLAPEAILAIEIKGNTLSCFLQSGNVLALNLRAISSRPINSYNPVKSMQHSLVSGEVFCTSSSSITLYDKKYSAIANITNFLPDYRDSTVASDSKRFFILTKEAIYRRADDSIQFISQMKLAEDFLFIRHAGEECFLVYNTKKAAWFENEKPMRIIDLGEGLHSPKRCHLQLAGKKLFYIDTTESLFFINLESSEKCRVTDSLQDFSIHGNLLAITRGNLVLIMLFNTDTQTTETISSFYLSSAPSQIKFSLDGLHLIASIFNETLVFDVSHPHRVLAAVPCQGQTQEIVALANHDFGLLSKEGNYCIYQWSAVDNSWSICLSNLNFGYTHPHETHTKEKAQKEGVELQAIMQAMSASTYSLFRPATSLALEREGIRLLHLATSGSTQLIQQRSLDEEAGQNTVALVP